MEFDKLVEVLVDATDVGETGQRYIRQLLTTISDHILPGDWDWSRLVQKGKFRGKLPKRVATYYKKTYGESLSFDVQTRIGNRVDQYSFSKKTYTLDFTKKLDWCADDFGDLGSCFWGCRKLAREALMENGVFAVRFYRESGVGYARAFVIRAEDSLIIFNAYGLPCRTIAYILAILFDYPYRKEIDLYIRGDRDNLIWLNEDAHQIGLIPPAGIVRVEFDVSYAQCSCCDRFCSIDDGDYNDAHEEFICFKCQ